MAKTALGGFALQNATPTILSWTAPNDGVLHFVHCIARIEVTAAETGGDCNIATTLDGQATDDVVFGGSLGTGFAGPSINRTPWYYPAARPIDPGSTVSLVQAQALTAGAAKVFAALFAL